MLPGGPLFPESKHSVDLFSELLTYSTERFRSVVRASNSDEFRFLVLCTPKFPPRFYSVQGDIWRSLSTLTADLGLLSQLSPDCSSFRKNNGNELPDNFCVAL